MKEVIHRVILLPSPVVVLWRRRSINLRDAMKFDIRTFTGQKLKVRQLRLVQKSMHSRFAPYRCFLFVENINKTGCINKQVFNTHASIISSQFCVSRYFLDASAYCTRSSTSMVFPSCSLRARKIALLHRCRAVFFPCVAASLST